MMKKLGAIILLGCLGLLLISNKAESKPEVVNKEKLVVKKVVNKSINKRIEYVKNYFKQINSPLENSASSFVEAGDVYNIDFIILIAISGAESGFARGHLCGNFNPFGYGQPCWDFDSYEEAIWQVAKTIGKSAHYKQFQESGSIGDFARAYNSPYAIEYEGKIRYFSERFKASKLK